MFQSLEAEIMPNGQVRLLEPVQLETTHRALLTVLESVAGDQDDGVTTDNSQAVLDFLKSPAFRNRRSYSIEEVEAHVQDVLDAREEWD